LLDLDLAGLVGVDDQHPVDVVPAGAFAVAEAV